MSRLLLRAIKRRTSWEKTAEEFFDMELTNGSEVDLNVSVYLVSDEPPSILQALSEHWASTKSPAPDNPCRALDAVGGHAGTVEEKPGTGCFEFTRESHREVRFMREAEVRDFACLLIQEREGRTRTVGRDDVRRYMAERFVARDDEWNQLGASKPQWREWASKQAKQTANSTGWPSAKESLNHRDEAALDVGVVISTPANDASTDATVPASDHRDLRSAPSGHLGPGSRHEQVVDAQSSPPPASNNPLQPTAPRTDVPKLVPIPDGLDVSKDRS